MNKEEIKALLAIIHRQSFAGVTREAVENNLEYRLLCSAATKLERMLLDIESGYNKLVNAENSRKGAGMSEEAKERAACHPQTAESGQQADLPTKGGQQDSIARNTENAKQGNLLCPDAAQLNARKEKA